MISKETVFEVIQECADAKGVKLSDEFEQDFEMHIPNVPLEFLSQIRYQLCARIREILETDTALAEKYAVTYSQIFSAVRLKLICLLDFQNHVTKSVNGGKSSRGLLKDFLQNLKEGESWDIKKLCGWKIDGINIGSRLYERIRNLVGFWDQGIVMLILGEEGKKLLQRNPFKKQRNKNKIKNPYVARHYLETYLTSLPDGETWSHKAFFNWKNPHDGIKGSSVIDHLAQEGQKFTEPAVRAALGEDADSLLSRNPFTERPRRLTSAKKAKAALLEFLGGLPEGEEWSFYSMFDIWESKNGVKGKTLYGWIYLHFGSSDETAVRAVLSEDADSALQRNPFKKITGEESATRGLKTFLDSLPEGKGWSPKDFDLCRPSNYAWIRKNITRDDTIDWLYVLIKMVPLEDLRRHPFRHRRRDDLNGISIKEGAEGLVRPCATTRRRERSLDRTVILEETHGFIPDPESLVMAKEGVERMMQRREFMSGIYKYLEISEWILLNRFYAGGDIGDDKLLLLMGRIREIIQEHRPELI